MQAAHPLELSLSPPTPILLWILLHCCRAGVSDSRRQQQQNRAAVDTLEPQSACQLASCLNNLCYVERIHFAPLSSLSLLYCGRPGLDPRAPCDWRGTPSALHCTVLTFPGRKHAAKQASTICAAPEEPALSAQCIFIICLNTRRKYEHEQLVACQTATSSCLFVTLKRPQLRSGGSWLGFAVLIPAA
jgi:hypothetical protein